MTSKYSWLHWCVFILLGAVLLGPFVSPNSSSLVYGPEQIWRDWLAPAQMGLTGAFMLTLWFVRPLRELAEGVLLWPTWGWYWSKRPLRLGLGVPLVAVMSAFWLLLSVQAYVDRFAYWTGYDRVAAPAIVLEVIEKSGKACKLLMTLRMGDAHEEICVDDRIMGPLPFAGQTVWVQGRDTFSGFWVQKIHTVPHSYQRPIAEKETCPMVLLVCPI